MKCFKRSLKCNLTGTLLAVCLTFDSLYHQFVKPNLKGLPYANFNWTMIFAGYSFGLPWGTANHFNIKSKVILLDFAFSFIKPK